MGRDIEKVKEALKKAGRGGWRVDFEGIYKVTDKFIAEQRNKSSVFQSKSKKKK